MKMKSVREVWSCNLRYEFGLINKAVSHCRYAAFDTEFPGTVIVPNVDKSLHSHLPPLFNYRLMKANVDVLNLIQLGLTLSDEKGIFHTWQFNFRDFQVERDVHNPNSIALLKKQGIDFDKNREDGIDSEDFARMVLGSRLVFNTNITWVVFHGTYDFGFLIKILTGRQLPHDLALFISLMSYYFGRSVFDVKHVIKFCGGSLYGGLDRVGELLGVDRTVGKSHQAGSDSLVTMQSFGKLRESYSFNGRCLNDVVEFKSVLNGLVWS